MEHNVYFIDMFGVMVSLAYRVKKGYLVYIIVDVYTFLSELEKSDLG